MSIIKKVNLNIKLRCLVTACRKTKGNVEFYWDIVKSGTKDNDSILTPAAAAILPNNGRALLNIENLDLVQATRHWHYSVEVELLSCFIPT
jgi:hypothetical protein